MGVTPTPDGSSITDFPCYEGAKEKLSELLGIAVDGDESLYALAKTLERGIPGTGSSANPTIVGKE